ncbi:hypothetical protein ACEQ8H_003347 [Pleosporales sp. CAS-2024a]
MTPLEDQYSVSGNAGSHSEQGEPPAGDIGPEASFLQADSPAPIPATSLAVFNGSARDWDSTQFEVFGMQEAISDSPPVDQPGFIDLDEELSDCHVFVAKETHFVVDDILGDFEIQRCWDF